MGTRLELKGGRGPPFFFSGSLPLYGSTSDEDRKLRETLTSTPFTPKGSWTNCPTLPFVPPVLRKVERKSQILWGYDIRMQASWEFKNRTTPPYLFYLLPPFACLCFPLHSFCTMLPENWISLSNHFSQV